MKNLAEDFLPNRMIGADSPQLIVDEPFSQEVYERILLKRKAEKKLKVFVEQAWPWIVPTPFIDGWHIDAICDHLQAITFRYLTHLIINIPPRHSKSFIASVMWSAWEWGPAQRPETGWLLTSYTASNTIRDNRRCRKLILSPWYQQNWGDRFDLLHDQSQKVRFDNTEGGYRVASSVGGVGTGEGGDRIIADDPHKVDEVESTTQRQNVIDWWNEEMISRGNNPDEAAFVIIMQRVHEDDLTAHALASEFGYEHLCLPAEYEGNRCKTALGIVDKRKKDEQRLSPKRFSKKFFDAIKKQQPYVWASQYQQRPFVRGGNLFNTSKFNLIKEAPPIIKSVRSWDKAGTAGGGAFSAGVKMGISDKGRFVVLDVKRGQWGAPEREDRIEMAAEFDGVETHVVVEQEPGSGGKESAEATIRRLAGFIVSAERVTGAKEVRAEPYASQVEAGNVDVLQREWTQEFITEHEIFGPGAKYKDQVDAAASAFNYLAAERTTKEYGGW